jgi:hypothetical protein
MSHHSAQSSNYDAEHDVAGETAATDSTVGVGVVVVVVTGEKWMLALNCEMKQA